MEFQSLLLSSWARKRRCRWPRIRRLFTFGRPPPWCQNELNPERRDFSSHSFIPVAECTGRSLARFDIGIDFMPSCEAGNPLSAHKARPPEHVDVEQARMTLGRRSHAYMYNDKASSVKVGLSGRRPAEVSAPRRRALKAAVTSHQALLAADWPSARPERLNY